MNSFKDDTLLSTLAAQMEADPFFMSYVLAKYCHHEGLDQDDLAAYLGVSRFLLARLALCKRPEVESPNCGQAITQIADFALIDEIKLARIIREVDSLSKLGNFINESQIEDAVLLPFSAGVLAAARDQIEDDDEELKE